MTSRPSRATCPGMQPATCLECSETRASSSSICTDSGSVSRCSCRRSSTTSLASCSGPRASVTTPIPPRPISKSGLQPPASTDSLGSRATGGELVARLVREKTDSTFIRVPHRSGGNGPSHRGVNSAIYTPWLTERPEPLPRRAARRKGGAARAGGCRRARGGWAAPAGGATALTRSVHAGAASRPDRGLRPSVRERSRGRDGSPDGSAEGCSAARAARARRGSMCRRRRR
jgi:hypothetical protein